MGTETDLHRHRTLIDDLLAQAKLMFGSVDPYVRADTKAFAALCKRIKNEAVAMELQAREDGWTDGFEEGQLENV